MSEFDAALLDGEMPGEGIPAEENMPQNGGIPPSTEGNETAPYLYAGKYRTAEELEEAYANAQRLIGRRIDDLAQDPQIREEAIRRAQAEQPDTIEQQGFNEDMAQDVREALSADAVPGVSEDEVAESIRLSIPPEQWQAMPRELRGAMSQLVAHALLGEKVRTGQWQPAPAAPRQVQAKIPGVGVPNVRGAANPQQAAQRELVRQWFPGLPDEAIDRAIREYERDPNGK